MCISHTRGCKPSIRRRVSNKDKDGLTTKMTTMTTPIKRISSGTGTSIQIQAPLGLSGGGCSPVRYVVASNQKYRDISPGCRIENPKVVCTVCPWHNSSSNTVRIRRSYEIVALAEVVFLRVLGRQGSCIASFVSEVLFSASPLPLCWSIYGPQDVMNFQER